MKNTDKIKRVWTQLGKTKGGLLILLFLLGLFLVISDRGVVIKSASDIDTELTELCEKMRLENVYVHSSVDKSGGIDGVVVVCKEGERNDIKLKISDMLCSLYGIPSHRVYVTGFV